MFMKMADIVHWSLYNNGCRFQKRKVNRLLKRRSFADSVFSVRYFVWSRKVWTSQMLLWHVKMANILRPTRSSWLPFVHSVYTVNLLRLFHLAAIWSSDIFDTVNLSFWGWSIGSAHLVAAHGTVLCTVDKILTVGLRLRGNLGNWTLTHE